METAYVLYCNPGATIVLRAFLLPFFDFSDDRCFLVIWSVF